MQARVAPLRFLQAALACALAVGLAACGSSQGAITGTVKVTGAADNSGVVVTVQSQSQTTAADGTYRIEKLEPMVYTVSAAKEGFVTKTQQVTVSSGSTAIADFTLDVTNRSPVITALTASPPTVARAGKTTLVALATDGDGDPLAYEWTLPSGWSFDSVDKSKASAVTIVAPDLPGQTATITLTVTDGQGGTTSGTVVVSTSSPNGPVISAVSAVPSLVHKSGTINLSVSATDPDNQALTYEWTAPMGWTLTPSTSGTTATLVAPATNGLTATVTVKVTNALMLSAIGSALVGTAENLPPLVQSLSADHQQVLPGGVVHAVVSATDPDGDALTYTWTSTDAAWIITGTGTSVTVTAPQQAGGSTSLKVAVSDGIGGTTNATVLLTTSGCPVGKLNCDKNDLNGCEVDSTTPTNCGGCGVVCDPGQVCDHGSVCRAPSRSCKEILATGKSLGDGLYFILPPGGGPDPIAVDCDMTTDGGGWTGFYASKNGSPNVFNHFELTSRDCTDPLTRCLQRLPGSAGNPEILGQCGSAKLSFFMTPLVRDYFVDGTQADWQAIDDAATLAGGADPSFATQLYTGNGLTHGFIISDNQNVNETFGAAFDNDANWNYCNGAFDTNSAMKLYYRNTTDHFEFTVDALNQASGAPFTTTVRALNRHGDVDPEYAGTVHFTSSDGGATLPVDYTFAAGDAGVHVFTNAFAIVATSGVQTITATDTVRAALTGTVNVHVATLGSSTQPGASCAAILAGGASGGDGVYWINEGGGPLRNYCDMTTDGGGWTAFYVNKNGSPNVFNHFEQTASDCPDPATKCMRRIPASAAGAEIMGACGSAKVGVFLSTGAANYFRDGTSSTWQALLGGRSIDGGGNPAYATYVWTGDGGSNYGFIVANQGTPGTFLSGYNPNNGWDYCNGNYDQTSGARLLYRNKVEALTASVAGVNQAAGTPFTITVRANNRIGGAVGTYAGTVHFTSTDGTAVLPADYTFVAGDNGVHTFPVTLNAATGVQTVTVTDTVTAALTASVKVNIAALGSQGTPASSCNAILVGAAAAGGDGSYWLTDGVTPYLAYCDMTSAGGGWTLVLKADGTKTTFLYDQALWTNSTLLNPSSTDFSMTEAKLVAWNTIAFTNVLVDMQRTDQSGPPHQLVVPKTATSMFALMSPNTFSATALGRAAWKSLVPSSSLQSSCNAEGFNVFVGSGGNSRVRIGILGNEQNDCSSPDSKVGVGAVNAPCFGDGNLSVGNTAGCGGDNGDTSIYAFSWVLVR